MLQKWKTSKTLGPVVLWLILLAVLLVNGVTAAILETRPGVSNAPKRPEFGARRKQETKQEG